LAIDNLAVIGLAAECLFYVLDLINSFTLDKSLNPYPKYLGLTGLNPPFNSFYLLHLELFILSSRLYDPLCSKS